MGQNTNAMRCVSFRLSFLLLLFRIQVYRTVTEQDITALTAGGLINTDVRHCTARLTGSGQFQTGFAGTHQTFRMRVRKFCSVGKQS